MEEVKTNTVVAPEKVSSPLKSETQPKKVSYILLFTDPLAESSLRASTVFQTSPTNQYKASSFLMTLNDYRSVLILNDAVCQGRAFSDSRRCKGSTLLCKQAKLTKDEFFALIYEDGHATLSANPETARSIPLLAPSDSPLLYFNKVSYVKKTLSALEEEFFFLVHGLELEGLDAAPGAVTPETLNNNNEPLLLQFEQLLKFYCDFEGMFDTVLTYYIRCLQEARLNTPETLEKLFETHRTQLQARQASQFEKTEYAKKFEESYPTRPHKSAKLRQLPDFNRETGNFDFNNLFVQTIHV
eukprot:TRINITY_DN9799_c0_g1_i3.p1 TRINITY_DN9799_c0_g1~~TRINITY_DN9799_c0_g1_i3.p1  ORF type:complete len:299 (+),score=53.23 TRINITY_DN9799_c0_g1_i3:109-1005(+)